ncbi:Archaeal flagella protein [uncultured archaeon]|nr:Archaeal flagella protein [uncultured archaeon]
MLKDLTGKLGKIGMPEGSLIKKLESIKKNTEAKDVNIPLPVPDISDQLKKTQEELTKKVEELVNSKSEQIKANTDAVKNLENQIGKMDQILQSGKKGNDELKDRLDKIDETVLELASLYEVVSSTVNPFVGETPNPVNEKISEIEKKVEELSIKAPGVPPNLIEDFNIKFKALENTIEELKKIASSNVVNEEALVEKVAGLVVERVKPTIVQKTESGKPSTKPAQNRETPTSPARQTVDASPNQDDYDVRLPFLDNKPETSIVLLNWIEFLMEKVGRNNLADVLEYYIDIGWISQEVSSKMENYASGIDYYVEKPSWKLLPEDHTKSLLFIEQLRGNKLDKNSLSKLERDVDKIISSSEVLIL